MSSGKAKRKREDEELSLPEDPEHDKKELMRQSMSSPRVEIVPGLWRRFVRRRRSKNDAKPWTCSCGYKNNPTRHLFFDLPRFKCQRKGCKEILPDTYEFEFSLANIEANGVCPIGNLKDQENRPHCMIYSSATNAEVTERITRILMGEEVNGKHPMICMTEFMHKLKVRKQLRNVNFEKFGDLGYEDLRRILDILEGGVKIKGRSEECKISGTSQVAKEFSLVCKELAEGNPLLAIIRTGKGFDNLKWNEIYKPPKESDIVEGKSDGMHCITLLGGGMRKKRKMYYKFVNTHGIEFCRLSNLKRKDGIKGGFGNLDAGGLVRRPVKFIRYRKGVPGDSNLSCPKPQGQSIGGRIRQPAVTLKRKSVRTRAAAAFRKLNALSTREMLQSGDKSFIESGTKHTDKSVSSEMRSCAYALLEDLLQAQADDVRSCAAKVIGALSQGVSIPVPDLCLPKALQPFLPMFQQGLISGSAETKEQTAEGLGELIDVTSEKTLKEAVVPITEPLIRILGDRFLWQVKSAILSTLTIIIMKGGIALKPFLPQLQTTFVKCLQDNSRSVRTRAAAALGKLSALSTRVDPLVSDLLSMLQSGDESVKGSVLSALKGVIKHAGKSVSPAIRSCGCALLEDLLQAQADDVRSCAAKVIGTLSQYMEETEISDLVQVLLSLRISSDWCTRHGAFLVFSSISMHSPSKLCHLASFPSLVDLLKDSLKDKFPVREVATRTLGRIVCFELQSEASTLQLVQLLLLALRDDSSEVRRRSLSCIKAAAKINRSALATHHSILGPAIADALKDSSLPVRLAAERCALHVFQLTKELDNVTAAQKYLGMTGLEVKKIAKLNKESDGSDDDRT